MNTQTIHITGTHCPACKKLIEKRIMTISGVNEANVDFQTGETKIIASREITKLEIAKVLEGMPYKYE